MANTVHVTNISAQTEDKEIRDFFAFCGTISDMHVKSDGATKSADVTFERDTALKTALLLSNTLLGSNHITVTAADATGAGASASRPAAAGRTSSSSSSSSSDAGDKPATGSSDAAQADIAPEEKPRSRILAELLAHGYVVGDATLQKAIELDAKNNVSSRFYKTLQRLDEKYRASDRAKTADQSYGLSARANSLLHGIGSYFEHATDSGPGRRIVGFYASTAQQISDIHSEAKRLAELKKQEAGGSSARAAGLERVLGAAEGSGAGDKTATTSGSATGSSDKPTVGAGSL